MQLRYSLLAATSLVASAILAQPVIDASNNVPLYSAGQQFSVEQSSWTDQGPSGANVTYNYWSLISTGPRTYTFNDAMVTPTHLVIPSATFLSTDSGTDTLFYTVTATGLEQVGVAASLEGKLNFTDPIVELKYPCTYGTTWTDATAASYTVAGFPVTRTGTISGNADGYGVLNVSEVSYPSVLRVHLRKDITDASLPTTIHRISNIWSFYSETTPYPVLKLTEDSVTIGGGVPSVARSSQWIGGPGGVGMQDISFDEVQFSAYPNPASDAVTVSLNAAKPMTCIAEVTSATGQVVLTQRLNGSQDNLDVRALSPGVYQLRLISTEGVLGMQRLVVK